MSKHGGHGDLHNIKRLAQTHALNPTRGADALLYESRLQIRTWGPQRGQEAKEFLVHLSSTEQTTAAARES